MIIRDKYGWAVEQIKGRPITNFLRLLLHGNISQTYRKLHKEKYVTLMTRLYSESVIDSKTLHIITDRIDKL